MWPCSPTAEVRGFKSLRAGLFSLPGFCVFATVFRLAFIGLSFIGWLGPQFLLGVRWLSEAVVLRGWLARRVREEAEKHGLSVDEYLVEVLSQGLDPKDRALEYIEATEDLLAEAREELGKGNVRQAAEKLWGAAALAVKAYAYWKEGRRLSSHGELWEYKRRLEEELGEWVSDAWFAGNTMHVCFYEGWCAEKDVEDAYKRIERLVAGVASLLKDKKSD
jgi:hypothetical protein